MVSLLNRSWMGGTVALLALVLSGCVVPPGGSFPDNGHGLVTTYTVTLRHFASGEARHMVDVMAREFPGYRSHTLMSSDSATRRYSYVTSARPHKMEEWLTILLGDMNFNPDSDVNIEIQGVEITVEKLNPAFRSPRFSGVNGCFQQAAAPLVEPDGRPATPGWERQPCTSI